MLNVGNWINRHVAKIDPLGSGNLRRNVGLDLPHEFYHLYEDLWRNTPKEERGPLTGEIINQLQYLSKHPTWPSFGIVSGISDGERWVGPKMNSVFGAETLWGTVPTKSSETLSTLSDGLEYLGAVKIDELLSSPALKGWTPPNGFSELPMDEQMRIMQKALRENPTN